MGWLKRNLFFAIGVAAAIALLAGAAFYTFSSIAKKDTDYKRLREIYSTLGGIKPGSDVPENVEAAHNQAGDLRKWIRKTRDYFQPIDPIPSTVSGLTDDAFARALHRTLTQMQHDAEVANVVLPPQYNFSF